MKKKVLALCLLFVLAFSVFSPLGSVAAYGAAQTQQVANLVVFVNFSDDSESVFEDAASWSTLKGLFDYSLTGLADTSFKNYISTISNGTLQVINYFPQDKGTTAMRITLPNSRAYYQGTGPESDYNLVHEAVLKAAALSLPSADALDKNSDGALDNLVIIVQGRGEGAFYPHKANYDGTDKIAGLYVNTYNVIDTASLLESLSKQGVLSHEFLHSMGFADLYRYTAPGTPVGGWDIMSQTSLYQQYPLTYFRYTYGWMGDGIPTLDAAQTGGTAHYTLKAVTAASGDRALKITTPLSDNEYFVLEYRQKNEAAFSADSFGYERKIPSSGLLAYRIDNNVQPKKSNADGKNYVYIFRPNTAENHAAATEVISGSNGMSEVWNAAINPAEGETQYGSTALDAPCTTDTIFYADGQNSGIAITNIAYSADGEEISFDITYPDYSDLSLWNAMGSALPAAGSGQVSLAAAADGSLYAAYRTVYQEGINIVYDGVLARWNGTAWEQAALIRPGYSVEDMVLTACNGQLYAAWVGDNQTLACGVLNGSTVTPLWQQTLAYPKAISLLAEGNALYLACITGDNADNILVLDGLTGSTAAPAVTGSQLVTPKLSVLNGQLYLLYAEAFDNAGSKPRFMRYSTENGWQNVYTADVTDSRTHTMAVQNGTLYAAAANQKSDGTGKTVFITYDGTTWAEESLAQLSGASELLLSMDGTVPYLTCRESSVNGRMAVYTKTAGTWAQLYADLATKTGGLAAQLLYNGEIYVAYSSAAEDSAELYIKHKPLPGAVNPPAPGTESYLITVTPPQGYTDTTLYIDGATYTGTQLGSTLRTEINTATAKTATLYRYNENGIPVGMYVWKLQYANGVCTAVPVPELEDLLTYHGFSIRVDGGFGIRFKTGIDVAKRTALQSGLAGYTLREYGTLVMREDARDTHPFVKGDSYVSFGRSYWYANGWHDMIFETRGGRHRFTSVLVDLPNNRYATEYAFRGYVILQQNGTDILLYGPPVARSIYYIAQQVIASGEFAVGSKAYNAVMNIITYVEAQG